MRFYEINTKMSQHIKPHFPAHNVLCHTIYATFVTLLNVAQRPAVIIDKQQLSTLVSFNTRVNNS